MANLDFTSYAGLQNAVGQYLNRRDLSDQIPGFIAQAHAKFNRELRVRDMHQRSQAVTDGDYIPVPDDFLQVFSLELGTEPACWSEPLKYVSEEDAKSYRAQHFGTGSGPLRAYSIFGNTFELVPAQGVDVDFRLKYFAAIPRMIFPADSNWLLLKSPDLYLYGALVEATPFLKDDGRLQMWATMRQQAIDAMHLESERALKPQSSLRATRRSFG